METMVSSSIKKRIMRRIHIIWFTRRVLPLLVLETAAAGFIARQLAEYIFFNHVLQNAVVHTFSRSPVMIVDFFFRALLHTDIAVQFLLAVSVFMIILFLRDAARTIRTFSPLGTKHKLVTL